MTKWYFDFEKQFDLKTLNDVLAKKSKNSIFFTNFTVNPLYL